MFLKFFLVSHYIRSFSLCLVILQSPLSASADVDDVLKYPLCYSVSFQIFSKDKRPDASHLAMMV